MKKIIVPIDFSENSEKALHVAKMLAIAFNSELIIIHAFQTMPSNFNFYDGGIMPTIPSIGLSTQSFEIENQYKEQLQKKVDALLGEHINASFSTYQNSVTNAVEEAIEEHNADLVVIGRTGTGGFLDKLIGSSATSIALRAKCPVMVIPPQSTMSSIKKILYTSQLEYEEISNIAEILAFNKTLGGQIIFLKINSDHQPDIQPANQYIAEIKQEEGMENVNFIIRDYNDVKAGIVAYADEVQADLIAVSSRERSFLEEFLINPSLTKKLILDTHIPLLIFHLK